MSDIYKPLSDHQSKILQLAPLNWALEPGSGFTKTIGVLAERDLVERKKLGQKVFEWRRKPHTFREAVQMLIDRLPQGERSIRQFHACEELKEVRAMLACMPPEKDKVYPFVNAAADSEEQFRNHGGY